jgi:murein DD-endopeptidase MepM/ murein hydrolase activator NlpD
MTSRQAGRAISDLYARSDGVPRRRNVAPKRQQPAGRRERYRLGQLAVSAAVFAVLVAVKLLVPAGADGLHRLLSGPIEQSMDVSAVFSAVGRAMSGSEQTSAALQDIWQAVFHPGEDDAVAVSGSPEPLFGEPDPLAALRESLEGGGNSFGWLPAEAEKADAPAASAADPGASSAEAPAAAVSGAGSAVQSDAAAPTKVQKLSGEASLTSILYSGKNLPEHVSLEQEILGFDYCVPVQGTVSSGFGYREHPVEGEEKFHYGVDLAADEGADICCFADGTVTAVGESSSYGKYLIVSHENGFSTLYAHCSAIGVSSGTSVRKGQKIAQVGQTGLATGPHLHFELHSGDVYLNPIYYVGT